VDMLLIAGGPSDYANLKKVKLFSRQQQKLETATFNMDKYLKKSTPLPLPVHGGDAIYVPSKKMLSPFLIEILRGAIYVGTSYLIYTVSAHN
jgi:hypothetical protein